MTVIYSAQIAEPQATKARNGMLPLLVVLFVISYAILTLLVVEQGRTIESQRGLLREMLKDSQQLAVLKEKMAHDVAVHTHGKTTELQDKDSGSGDTGKGTGKDAKKPGKSARLRKEAPEKPAADLQDVRRSTRVI